ncbi:MAG: hypothetical protein Q4E61_01795 [Alphaproteobacteria bacterium]|nr:hypothetical protein [Alphaproteobacteria bacterium]
MSIDGGVVIQHLRNSNAKIYDNLLKFRNSINVLAKYHLQLAEGTDYLFTMTDKGIPNNPWGFINKASCETKLKRMYEKYWKPEIAIRFPLSEGFRVSPTGASSVMSSTYDEGVEEFTRLKFESVYLTNVNYPKFKVEILRGREEVFFSELDFSDSDFLRKEIVDYITPDTIQVLQSWDSATNPVTTKKNGLTLGLSGAYSKSLFPKASSTFGLYTGVEGFAEINPNESKSNGFSIKEKSFGFRPFVGVIKKDNWTIYALGGVKCAKRDIKSDMFHVKKGKLSYEIGIGSDYILSERFSISAKFIKCLTSKFNINGLSFQTSSTKILFSLNYHFK